MPPESDSTLLCLNCFVDGDLPDQTFTVKVLKTENVSILRKMIKEEKAHRLKHVDASDLNLFLVSGSFIIDDLATKRPSTNGTPLKPYKRLSSLFAGDPSEDNLHIWVKAPPASDPAQLLSVNCFVLGDKPNETVKPNETFTVKVLKTENVSILRKMIKEEKAHRLKYVDASDLILTQVSLAVDDDLGENLKGVELTPLNPLLSLSQVFPQIEENRLHIVVQAPPQERLGAKDVEEEERRDQITALDKRFLNVISRILKAMPPSESAKSSNYTKSQLTYSIYDGRYKANKPRTSVAPPVQLFHPVFGHFLDVVKSKLTPPDDIIRKTTAYMKAASAIYTIEEDRRAALTPLLREILNVNIQMILNKDKTNPDGVVEMALGVLLFLLFLEEDKNELGDGGSDPSTQTGLSTARCWAQDKYKQFRNATNCPTFLIATAGPWIVVQGAVITDGVIVQRLTDYVWVGIDSVLNESHILLVARVFYALKMSLEKLNAYYRSLQPTSDHPIGSRYFPSITAYRQDNVLVEFEYVGYLENGPDCVTLRARTIAEPRQDIVVKFVDHYGKNAHRILADEGLAPKLLYCGSPRLDDTQPSYQSISMVVMEYINGNTLAVAKHEMNEETMKRVQSEVWRALELLHDHGLVFGDLRLPNIMITQDGKVKLIDFNWAGEGGQAKYPFLISHDIAWPKGVEPLALITPEHDLDMWSKLF